MNLVSKYPRNSSKQTAFPLLETIGRFKSDAKPKSVDF